jgi:hypothetical protein
VKLYIFKNKKDNYCSGNFHFFAMNDGEVKRMADIFEKQHNKNVDMSINYMVDLILTKSIPVSSGHVKELR